MRIGIVFVLLVMTAPLLRADADRFTLNCLPPQYLAADSPAAGDQPEHHDATNEANNPLTPKITLNLQDYYIPRFENSSDDANQLLFRGVIPHKLGGLPQLFRFTLPVVSNPDGDDGHTTGVGDLTLIDWIIIPDKSLPFQLGVGPVLVVPMGPDAVTSGKWQTGASAVAIAPQEWGLLGGLVTYQFSFAGDSDRDDVSLFTLQPFFIYNLPEGFYLRSTAIWNFDWNAGNYYIPLGFGAGKVWALADGTTINLGIEPQYTVLHDNDAAPEWQIFVALNFQFPIGH